MLEYATVPQLAGMGLAYNGMALIGVSHCAARSNPCIDIQRHMHNAHAQCTCNLVVCWVLGTVSWHVLARRAWRNLHGDSITLADVIAPRVHRQPGAVLGRPCAALFAPALLLRHLPPTPRARVTPAFICNVAFRPLPPPCATLFI